MENFFKYDLDFRNASRTPFVHPKRRIKSRTSSVLLNVTEYDFDDIALTYFNLERRTVFPYKWDYKYHYAQGIIRRQTLSWELDSIRRHSRDSKETRDSLNGSWEGWFKTCLTSSQTWTCPSGLLRWLSWKNHWDKMPMTDKYSTNEKSMPLTLKSTTVRYSWWPSLVEKS